MNTSEAAKQEIICLDTTPCLFGGVSSFREHLTILSLVVLQFLLPSRNQQNLERKGIQKTK